MRSLDAMATTANTTTELTSTPSPRSGGSLSGWLAVACSLRSSPGWLLFNVIGSNSKILFHRDPAQRIGGGRAVFDDRQRCVSRDRQQATGVDRRRLYHVGQLQYSSSPRCPRRPRTPARWRSAGWSRTEGSYIRNSVKATVDADGTVTFVPTGRKGSVLKAWMQVFGTVKLRATTAAELAEHLRLSQGPVQIATRIVIRNTTSMIR